MIEVKVLIVLSILAGFLVLGFRSTWKFARMAAYYASFAKIMRRLLVYRLLQGVPDCDLTRDRLDL